MFGNRRGRRDAVAIDDCAAGLERIAPLAQEHGVTICLELLNSRIDHPDYQGDRTAFGVEVVRRVGSPRARLPYDIYPMPIMEGEIIRTLRGHRQPIAHFHTGGAPGRPKPAGTPEVKYR